MSHHARHAGSQWCQQILIYVSSIKILRLRRGIKKWVTSGDIALNEGTPSIMLILPQNLENV